MTDQLMINWPLTLPDIEMCIVQPWLAKVRQMSIIFWCSEPDKDNYLTEEFINDWFNWSCVVDIVSDKSYSDDCTQTVTIMSTIFIVSYSCGKMVWIVTHDSLLIIKYREITKPFDWQLFLQIPLVITDWFSRNHDVSRVGGIHARKT